VTVPERSLGVLARSASPPWARLGISRSLAVVAFATAVLVALAFSTLRSRIIELRYRAAEVVREERALEENRRALAVRVRRLQDPRRLAELARRRGFARPERVVDLEPRSGDLAQ
jgi:hypothetical protein